MSCHPRGLVRCGRVLHRPAPVLGAAVGGTYGERGTPASIYAKNQHDESRHEDHSAGDSADDPSKYAAEDSEWGPRHDHLSRLGARNGDVVAAFRRDVE